MSRLTEKVARAAGVAQRISTSVEKRADALLAREHDLETRAEDVFAPHNAILDEAQHSLDEAEAALRLLSNDPLSRRSSEQQNSSESDARARN